MPDDAGAGQGGGLRARVREMLGLILTMIESRLELASIEVREEVLRWLNVVLLAALAFFLGQIGLLLLTLAMVALFPGHAVLTLGIAGTLYLTGAIACVVTLRQRLKDRPPPFADSVAELKRDREWLSSMN
jgi:uncharacterized membrane protein YqjE